MIATRDSEDVCEPHGLRTWLVTRYEDEATLSRPLDTSRSRHPTGYRKNGCEELVRLILDLLKQDQILSRSSTDRCRQHDSEGSLPQRPVSRTASGTLEQAFDGSHSVPGIGNPLRVTRQECGKLF